MKKKLALLVTILLCICIGLAIAALTKYIITQPINNTEVTTQPITNTEVTTPEDQDILAENIAEAAGQKLLQQIEQSKQTGETTTNIDIYDNVFIEISRQKLDDFNDLRIIQHKATGKLFIIYNGTNQGGITPLN